MNSQELVRVALVGYGVAGRVFHEPLINATHGLQLTTVVARSVASRSLAVMSNPGVRTVADFADLFESGNSPDVVVVATPHKLHARMALDAARRGAVVVVDKPFAASAAEAQKLYHTLREERLEHRVTVFQNRRWDGDYMTVSQLVREGRFGQVHEFESRFERWRPQPRVGAWRELFTPEEGGGVLLDIGPHLVDQAVELFGPPSSVYAEVRSLRPGVTAGDELFVSLTHQSGTVSHLTASALAADRAPRFRVRGALGSFTKFALDVQEEQLRAGVDPTGLEWGVEPPDRYGEWADGMTVHPVPAVRGGWPRFYESVRGMVTKQDPPPVQVRDAVLVQEILESAKMSAETGTIRYITHREHNVSDT